MSFLIKQGIQSSGQLKALYTLFSGRLVQWNTESNSLGNVHPRFIHKYHQRQLPETYLYSCRDTVIKSVQHSSRWIVFGLSNVLAMHCTSGSTEALVLRN